MSQPAPAPYESPGPPTFGPPPKKGLAIASMVLGILALLLALTVFYLVVAVPLALVAIGLGIRALVLARRGTHGGKGMAIVGLVTSLLPFLMLAVMQLALRAVEVT